MRSLQLKFNAMVVTLLSGASLSLAWVATEHERRALEAEVQNRGLVLTTQLANAARTPLVTHDRPTLQTLVDQTSAQDGVVAVQLLDRRSNVIAALARDELDENVLHAGPDGNPAETVRRKAHWLVTSVPVRLRDQRIGEARVAFDLEILVEPTVRSGRRQLASVAVAVVVIGLVAGIVFVGFLVGPLQRLRTSVERLAAGDFQVRVPPTSNDEIGELTRSFNEMGQSLQQKERIQSAFGRYVSDYVLNQVLQTAEGEELTGAEREVTVLFADIRSFTRLSEGLKAQNVVQLLNEIFQLASDRILARGGTIDKFIGDSVMAYFGAPVPHPDHPLRAVSAAHDIAEAIGEMNERRRAANAEARPIELGFGIHTGVVVVGNIGSERKMDFTAIGDVVNVAHRLEKLARPGEILVSEAVPSRDDSFAFLKAEHPEDSGFVGMTGGGFLRIIDENTARLFRQGHLPNGAAATFSVEVKRVDAASKIPLPVTYPPQVD